MTTTTTKVWITEDFQSVEFSSHQLFRLVLEMSGLQFYSQPLYMNTALDLLQGGMENIYPEATQVQVLDPQDRNPEWVTVVWL